MNIPLLIANGAIINSPATDTAIAKIESCAPFTIPSSLIEVYKCFNGCFLGPETSLYGVEELVERNDTYRIQEFLPDYCIIGELGGTHFFAMNLSTQAVFLVPYGAYFDAFLIPLSVDINSWIDRGLPSPIAPI